MAIVTETVFETAALSDSWSVRQRATLRDGAVITSAWDTDRVARLTVSDTFVGSSSATPARVVLAIVQETAAVTDELVTFAAVDTVHETAVVVSEATSRRVTRVVVAESADIASTAYPESYGSVRDRFVGSSYTYPSVRVAEIVYEVASVVATISDAAGSRRVVVSDIAVVSDAATNRVTLRELVTSEGFLTSWLHSNTGLSDAGWDVNDAWTCNIAAMWAMSRYSDVGVSNQNKRFAVSTTGLYEPSETFSAARLETGFLDFDSPFKKRLLAAYLMAGYYDSLTVTVTGEVDGSRASYDYTPLADITDDPTVVRVDVGRNFDSVYFSLAIASTGRAELFGGEMKTVDTQRRI